MINFSLEPFAWTMLIKCCWNEENAINFNLFLIYPVKVWDTTTFCVCVCVNWFYLSYKFFIGAFITHRNLVPISEPTTAFR